MLVVEDDPSIRRFIEMALDGEPVRVHTAGTLTDGLRALRLDGPFRLVFTDLMLPDGSGETLLQALATEPALRAGARVAVFSAGLSGERRERLLQLGADELIAKPAPVAQLLGCLHQALRSDAVAAAPAPAGSAVQRFFAGDQGLYDAYRASCLQQFAADLRSGDDAVARADWPALRRLAHSLKSVLLTLGHDADSGVARQLEHDAAASRADAARAGWATLAAALQRLAAPSA